ncbi:sugar phosphate nucleotidyltransferase [Paenibacillus tarimensis]|uniref:sugar phosphate nucleotidyltransferase n=1 Tax=Paenibacillus tarimensis TaxID=416012 RepID=UPI001F2B4C24|nr:sugar phosphate nucleotidyltransferase [Paenibacillus tarimensis]MCF2945623.1 NTP transferase domain-containing protein [Paenibacillus tarimensis]
MNIVIPLAGEGRRFREAGFHVPKMLIEVMGRPMLYWALDSLLPFFQGQHFIFVVQQAHLTHTDLEQVIYRRCPGAAVVAIDRMTRGQAESVWEARSVMCQSDPLLIFNGDTYVGTDIGRTLSGDLARLDGLINVFASSDHSFSYVELYANELVRSVREKRVISPWATSGLYYFRSAAEYLQLVSQAVEEEVPVEAGEWYVSEIYNRLIRAGGQVGIDKALFCHPLGTPLQMNTFINLQKSQGGMP